MFLEPDKKKETYINSNNIIEEYTIKIGNQLFEVIKYEKTEVRAGRIIKGVKKALIDPLRKKNIRCVIKEFDENVTDEYIKNYIEKYLKKLKKDI